MLKAVEKCLSQVHLLRLECHYFSREGGGLGGTTLSLWHFVTISLGRVGVKAIMDNVTKYDVFFEDVPKSTQEFFIQLTNIIYVFVGTL